MCYAFLLPSALIWRGAHTEFVNKQQFFLYIDPQIVMANDGFLFQERESITNSFIVVILFGLWQVYSSLSQTTPSFTLLIAFT